MACLVHIQSRLLTHTIGFTSDFCTSVAYIVTTNIPIVMVNTTRNSSRLTAVRKKRCDSNPSKDDNAKATKRIVDNTLPRSDETKERRLLEEAAVSKNNCV